MKGVFRWVIMLCIDVLLCILLAYGYNESNALLIFLPMVRLIGGRIFEAVSLVFFLLKSTEE